jgi:hypothetical protein
MVDVRNRVLFDFYADGPAMVDQEIDRLALEFFGRANEQSKAARSTFTSTLFGTYPSRPERVELGLDPDAGVDRLAGKGVVAR